MKYFQIILAVFSALLTLAILVLFVLGFIAWLGGEFNIILPGLGLIISGSLILIALFALGLTMLAITVWLVRTIYKKPLQ